jgi:cytochrome c553
MRNIVALPVLLAVAPLARAANLEAGRAKVAEVCAACHGAAGVSVSDAVPNLAAQRAAYLEAQLKALKEGTRKHPIMSPVATQLSAEEISDVAAYFASLPGAAAGARSEFMPALARTGVTFPEGYRSTFVQYHTVGVAAARQLRRYFANPIALRAAREGRSLPDGSVLFSEVYAARLGADGKPVVGPDGLFVADRLLFYSAMARQQGWGKEIPAMLRNDDWNYGSFTPDGKPRPGVNQAECLACHKPREKESFTFTLKELAAAREPAAATAR